MALLMVLVLALSACGKSEEGKNTETTKEEVTEANGVNQGSTEATTQTTEVTTEAIAEVTTEATIATTEATTQAEVIDYSDRLVAYELKEIDNPYINELFVSMANSIGITEKDEMEIYLADAREDTTADLPMYLDQNGVLNVYVPFPSIAGASYYYTLCQFN